MNIFTEKSSSLPLQQSEDIRVRRAVHFFTSFFRTLWSQGCFLKIRPGVLKNANERSSPRVGPVMANSGGTRRQGEISMCSYYVWGLGGREGTAGVYKPTAACHRLPLGCGERKTMLRIKPARSSLSPSFRGGGLFFIDRVAEAAYLYIRIHP